MPVEAFFRTLAVAWTVVAPFFVWDLQAQNDRLRKRVSALEASAKKSAAMDKAEGEGNGES